MGPSTTQQKKPPLGLKKVKKMSRVNFDYVILEIRLICSNLIEKMPPIRQSWAELCTS
jgi:hypothetical protein